MEIEKLIYGFVAVILGAIFIGIIAGQVNTDTSQATVSSETISIAAARLAGSALNESVVFTIANPVTSWRADNLADCKINNFVLKNSSGQDLTATTHYVFNQNTGTFTVKNVLPINNSNSNTTTASYNYCGDSYVSNSFGRSTAKMIGGFLALLTLIAIVSILYYYLNKFKK